MPKSNKKQLAKLKMQLLKEKDRVGNRWYKEQENLKSKFRVIETPRQSRRNVHSIIAE